MHPLWVRNACPQAPRWTVWGLGDSQETEGNRDDRRSRAPGPLEGLVGQVNRGARGAPGGAGGRQALSTDFWEIFEAGYAQDEGRTAQPTKVPSEPG